MTLQYCYLLSRFILRPKLRISQHSMSETTWSLGPVHPANHLHLKLFLCKWELLVAYPYWKLKVTSHRVVPRGLDLLCGSYVVFLIWCSSPHHSDVHWAPNHVLDVVLSAVNTSEESAPLESSHLTSHPGDGPVLPCSTAIPCRHWLDGLSMLAVRCCQHCCSSGFSVTGKLTASRPWYRLLLVPVAHECPGVLCIHPVGMVPPYVRERNPS